MANGPAETEGSQQFFLLQKHTATAPKHTTVVHRPTVCYHPSMTFKSLPLSIREVKATEAVLERLYNSARLGLKGDALAYNAGLLPTEFRRLCQMDPVAEYAVAKGHADTEAKMAKVIQDAAESGDAKVALDYLKHRADWVAKQQVQVDTTQSISITLALEQAQARVQAIQADVIDVIDHKQPVTLPHAAAEVRTAR